MIKKIPLLTARDVQADTDPANQQGIDSINISPFNDTVELS
jgi:hypothetical protein